MESHFIVTSVVGTMVAICGKAIPPAATQNASVGQQPGSRPCDGCTEKVAKAWVTVRG